MTEQPEQSQTVENVFKRFGYAYDYLPENLLLFWTHKTASMQKGNRDFQVETLKRKQSDINITSRIEYFPDGGTLDRYQTQVLPYDSRPEKLFYRR